MTNFDKMNILIVDDSKFSRTLLKNALKMAGYKVIVEAESPNEAFNLLDLEEDNGEPPGVDLILMDIVMDEIDGIEATRIIKKKERLRDIPIVMVTGETKKETLDKAFTAGAIDYITKPIDQVELRARVGSVLRLKREIDQRKDREVKLIELARQLGEANQMLKRLSSLDGLTGIANRRFFDETLDKEWRRSQREVKPLSLLLMDVDFFKPFNDHYGHQAGDEALKMVAEALSSVPNRPGDLVARYGGEEFVVILPATDSKNAMEIAEKMREAVEAQHCPHEKSTVHDCITISAGLATVVPDDPMTPKDLIEMADKNLYKAKQEGRNRIVAGEG